MTSTTLDNLVRIGKLKPFPANRSEFEQLLGLARTLLGTVTTSGTMATESQFILAYDAAHAASRAALRAYGYRCDAPLNATAARFGNAATSAARSFVA